MILLLVDTNVKIRLRKATENKWVYLGELILLEQVLNLLINCSMHLVIIYLAQPVHWSATR